MGFQNTRFVVEVQVFLVYDGSKGPTRPRFMAPKISQTKKLPQVRSRVKIRVGYRTRVRIRIRVQGRSMVWVNIRVVVRIIARVGIFGLVNLRSMEPCPGFGESLAFWLIPGFNSDRHTLSSWQYECWWPDRHRKCWQY